MAQLSFVLWLIIASTYIVYCLAVYMDQGLGAIKPWHYPGLIVCGMTVGLVITFTFYLLLFPLMFLLGVPWI